MNETWAINLLQLLFGQIGAVGTICVAVAGYMGWQLHLAQQATKELFIKMAQERADMTTKFESSQEKRVELLSTYLHTLSEFKNTLDSLVVLLNAGRRN